MEPQSPPSKIARLSDSGFGSSTRMEDGSIGLGLELGNGNGGGHIHHNRQYRPSQGGFTFFQMQELEHQSIIYKHIEAGLPVPHHLLLPIWKCVATSLGGGAGGCGPFSHYYGSPLYMEYKKSMDPEPERCKRTDGKKWRCSKQVVEDHKYCERHMNRGRHRSRKRVQLAAATTSHHLLSTTTISSSTNRDSNTNLSISLPI